MKPNPSSARSTVEQHQACAAAAAPQRHRFSAWVQASRAEAGQQVQWRSCPPGQAAPQPAAAHWCRNSAAQRRCWWQLRPGSACGVGNNPQQHEALLGTRGFCAAVQCLLLVFVRIDGNFKQWVQWSRPTPSRRHPPPHRVGCTARWYPLGTFFWPGSLLPCSTGATQQRLKRASSWWHMNCTATASGPWTPHLLPIAVEATAHTPGCFGSPWPPYCMLQGSFTTRIQRQTPTATAQQAQAHIQADVALHGSGGRVQPQDQRRIACADRRTTIMLVNTGLVPA